MLKVVLAVGLVLLPAGFMLWLWTPRLPESADLSSRAPVSSITAEKEPTSPAEKQHASESELATRLDLTADLLRKTKDAEAARAVLINLRASLSSLPPATASAAIREFLETQADASTQLDFKVGPNGLLKQASTLRVFLLDYLDQVDRPAAAAVAETILSTKSSPDEWAVSLRTYALANPNAQGKAYLQQKIREMLSYPAWQQNPSTGFLEAFDVGVYIGGGDLLPLFAELLRRQDNQAVARAAFLALDRLTLLDPGAVFAQLQSQPELMAGREPIRAGYFARADVRDARQKSILENYLLNPRITLDELSAFVGSYPNANFMISHNLLTQTLTPSRDALIEHDRKALEVVEVWLAEARFKNLQPALRKIRSRLETFVKQAGGAVPEAFTN